MIRCCFVLFVTAVLVTAGPLVGPAPAGVAAPQPGVLLDPRHGPPGTVIRVTPQITPATEIPVAPQAAIRAAPQVTTASKCTAAWDDDPPVDFVCGPDSSGQLGSTTLTAPTTASPGTHVITVCEPRCEDVDPVWKETAPFTVLAVVPDLSKLTLDQARDLLRAAGLELGEVTGPTDDSSARIALQTPKASSAVDPASAVDVTLVGAPPQRQVLVEVPGVLGMTAADARSLLAQQQLRLRVESGSGLVSEQQPAAGSRVPAGSQVSVKLRSTVGIELVTVPDVRRLKAGEAQRVLVAAGLVVHPAVPTAGTVTDQLPPAGSRVPRGSAVNLTLSTAPSWHSGLLAAALVGTGLLLVLIVAASAVRQRLRRTRRRRRPHVSLRSDCRIQTVTIRDTGRSMTHTAEIESQRHFAVSCEEVLR